MNSGEMYTKDAVLFKSTERLNGQCVECYSRTCCPLHIQMFCVYVYAMEVVYSLVCFELWIIGDGHVVVYACKDHLLVPHSYVEPYTNTTHTYTPRSHRNKEIEERKKRPRDRHTISFQLI